MPSANRGVQHSIEAPPAQRPGVGDLVAVHVATSMHEPGMLFAVQVGAVVADASGNTGAVHVAASIAASPCAASVVAAS